MQAPNSFHSTVPQGAHTIFEGSKLYEHRDGPDSKEGVHKRQ